MLEPHGWGRDRIDLSIGVAYPELRDLRLRGMHIVGTWEYPDGSSCVYFEDDAGFSFAMHVVAKSARELGIPAAKSKGHRATPPP